MTWIKTILILIVVLYVLGAIGLYLLQEKMIFPASVLPADYQFQFEADFDELNLEMEDGAMINALHFKTDEPKGLILYFHGNGDDLSRWGDVAIPFTSLGYDVLIMDYRGYGKSTGDRSKAAMLADAESVYAHATTLFDQEKIVVFGRSLGGAFASHVAAEFSPKQLILETPFYSVADVARSFAWMYPIKWLVRFNFTNYEPLRKVKCPITIFQGDQDMVVHIESARKLKAENDRINWVEFPGGTHSDLGGFSEYWSEIRKLLR